MEQPPGFVIQGVCPEGLQIEEVTLQSETSLRESGLDALHQ